MIGTGCLYVPDFPAWALGRVEAVERPVVVVSAGRAVAWTRSAGLRDVRPGDRVDRVLRLCPEALVRARDGSLEAAAWDEVLAELHGVTPFIASSRPPFAYFRAAVSDDLHTLARDLGIRIGIGPDRATARLAAVRAAGRHVVHVPAVRRGAFLDRFPVELLSELGYAEAVVEHLRLFGYPVLGRCAALTRRHLEGQFGPEGAALHELLHPVADLPIPPHVPPPSIVTPFETESEIDPGEAVPVVERLAEEGAEALGDRRTQRLVLEVHVARSARPRVAGRLLPEPHGDPAALRRFAVRLLEQVACRDDRIERLVLRMEALRRPVVQQVALFDHRPAVLGAVRRVHRRYPEAIRRSVHRAHVLFPEEAVSFEPYDPKAESPTGSARSENRRRPR